MNSQATWARMPNAGEQLANRVESKIRYGKCQRNHHRIRVRLWMRLDALNRTALALELMRRGHSTPLFVSGLFSTTVILPAGK